MRIYSDDLAFFEKVTEFLNNTNEPEGVYIHVALHDDDGQEVARWDYDGSWALVTDPKPEVVHVDLDEDEVIEPYHGKAAVTQ